MSNSDSRPSDAPLPKPFPREVEMDKPEGEPYRLLSVAPPLGESGAPLLDEVLKGLQMREEDQVQLHLDVIKNHFVPDPSIRIEDENTAFLTVDLELATRLLRR